MIYSPRTASQGVPHEGNISHIPEGQNNEMLYISVEEGFQCEQKDLFSRQQHSAWPQAYT